MLKYLVILLDDTSTSYCHYDVEDREKNLIPLNVLKGFGPHRLNLEKHCFAF